MWPLIFCLIVGEIYAQAPPSHPLEDLHAAQRLIYNARQHLPLCPRNNPTKPESCEDLYNRRNYASGVYTIWPRSRLTDEKSVRVYCDMNNGGGWTVIQRRGNFGRPQDYFFRDWESYKNGFGNVEKDFWLGNDNIFALTNQKETSARFDLYDWEKKHAYALYDSFWIEDEANKYLLNVNDYSGTAGDSLINFHNKQPFSTHDRDNDGLANLNCAGVMKGAWWYRNCHTSNLNGLYYQNGTYPTGYANGVDWSTFRGYRYSLYKTEIKIRSKGFIPNPYH